MECFSQVISKQPQMTKIWSLLTTTCRYYIYFARNWLNNLISLCFMRINMLKTWYMSVISREYLPPILGNFQFDHPPPPADDEAVSITARVCSGIFTIYVWISKSHKTASYIWEWKESYMYLTQVNSVLISISWSHVKSCRECCIHACLCGKVL
jgi:hypothetical protein